jgi:hypothetical protein
VGEICVVLSLTELPDVQLFQVMSSTKRELVANVPSPEQSLTVSHGIALLTSANSGYSGSSVSSWFSDCGGEQSRRVILDDIYFNNAKSKMC